MKTFLILPFLFSVLVTSAFADDFSERLLTQNEGNFGGKTAAGGVCNLKIAAQTRFGVDVDMDGNGFSPEHGTSAKDSAGEFKKIFWVRSYVEMTYGGWINSSGNVTPSTSVRLIFDRNSKITSYEIRENSALIATCIISR